MRAPRRSVIVVEGQTEQRFVTDFLAAEVFAACGLWVEARLIGRGRHKGGRVSLDRIATDCRVLLGGGDARVTTFFDFYGRAGAWPRCDALAAGATFQKKHEAAEADVLDAVHASGVGGSTLRRFRPYVQMHEFECLLFSDLKILESTLGRPGLAAALRPARDGCETPERINDGRQTAPSKRIIAVDPPYERSKVVRGPAAAAAIGLPKMRAACPRFDAWVRWLETPLDG